MQNADLTEKTGALTSGDIEVEEQKFHSYKNQLFKKDVYIDNTLISDMISFSEKIINIILVT